MIETLVELQNDHRNLVRLVTLLDKQATAEQAPDAAGLTLIADAVYYLTHFPDVFHHPREDALAGWLNRQGVLADALVRTLATQHADLETQGRDLLRDLESLVREETETWPGLAPRLGAYAKALRLNMATEEAQLLPIAFAEALNARQAIPAALALACEADPLVQQTDERFAQLRAVIMTEARCDCAARPAVTYQPNSGEPAS
ncbi:MAG: hemerythrin domain-containing protein [Rhodocyclaceae bacterium]